MKIKKKRQSPPLYKQEVSYTIRFRDADQLALIKKVAKQQGISFNGFVIDVCERTAKTLQKTNPRDPQKVVSDAINAALTER
jgi:predicted HicB family RNase H-like nuclease